ncbi:unnamed protein product, partial [Allacma fusca]
TIFKAPKYLAFLTLLIFFKHFQVQKSFSDDLCLVPHCLPFER